MGRPGRYTLSVMAWVAAYAGWSSVVGLVIAAVTGDRPREVSLGASAFLTVILPLVPTVVALWFNDWARDGFPSREQIRQRRTAVAPAAETVAPTTAPVVERVFAPAPAPAVPRAGGTVAPHVLGVPELRVAAHAEPGAFPVAPLLRDRD